MEDTITINGIEYVRKEVASEVASALSCQKEWEERNKLCAKAIKLYAKAGKLNTRSNTLYAEGNKLYDEANKRYAEADLVFIDAVIRHYGRDAEMEWNNKGCLVAGRDQYLN